MIRSAISIALIGFLLCTFGSAWASRAKNPDAYVLADIGSVESIDPARAYDNAGQSRLLAMYETLITFDGPHPDKFVPVLATEVPTVGNGGISTDGKTYTFKIRQGIKFHEGGTLTPEDVAYSLKRAMICDPAGGPMWMLLEALTGHGNTRNEDGIVPGIFEKIDKSIEMKKDSVVLHLPNPYPPLLGILCYSAHVVTDKQWAISKGCWDGNIANAAKYNKPDTGKEPLQKIANGTGAYKMKYWDPSNEFVFERFEDYWGPTPKLKTVIVKIVSEWSTRKLMLQNGDADRVHVGKSFLEEVKAMPGVKVYQVPQLAVTGACFTQKIEATANPYIGSGKLDGQGISPNFFSDINVRKAFIHAYDREVFKNDVLLGLGSFPSTPLVEGLPYYKKGIPTYEFDLEKAKAFLKKAWAGKVWEKGFKFTITYNTGREEREAAAHMLAENIMSLNPKFQIDVANIDWRDYMAQIRQFRIPIFIIGWGADYADPHNFVYPYMSSNGTYGKYMGVNNPDIDKLIDEGIKNVDPTKRESVYTRLQNIWYEEAMGIALFQPMEIWAYRDYVRGFIPNPIYSPAQEFFYRLSKK
jgi:peptide/nickel transport system substrate-binding protein